MIGRGEELPTCCPVLMAATARVILRVTNVSPRRGLSWLKRMLQCRIEEDAQGGSTRQPAHIRSAAT